VEIWLIRHAQPEWVRDGLAVGNPPLTSVGLRQAELTAAAYGHLKPTDIAVSPMLRARQTAAPLLAALGMDEQVEDWLEEVRDPDWHGMAAEVTYQAYERESRLSAHDRWRGIEGGENVRDFTERVSNGTRDWLARHGVRRADPHLPVWHIDDLSRIIAAVAHGGTNGVIVCELMGVPHSPWEWRRFAHQHAGVSRFRAFEIGDTWAFTLEQLSSVEHLPVGLRTY
jgi:2,3-bisphosphoglycerate-dependent phosphoglycerate mutase